MIYCSLWLEYRDGVALLDGTGIEINPKDDLTVEYERILDRIIKAKVNVNTSILCSLILKLP
jgi:hypothetical protein